MAERAFAEFTFDTSKRTTTLALPSTPKRSTREDSQSCRETSAPRTRAVGEARQVATLVGQGLMLPAVIRALGLAHFGHRERHTDRAEEYRARREAIAAATERLGQLTAERQLSEDVARPLLAEQRDRLEQFELRSALQHVLARGRQRHRCHHRMAVLGLEQSGCDRPVLLGDPPQLVGLAGRL